MQVCGFALKVQFMQETLPQIREHVGEFVALTDFSMRVDELRNLPECFQIFNDLLADTRTLNFYHDRATIPHGSAMHLGQRCSRGWLSIKFKEKFGDAPAQFG